MRVRFRLPPTQTEPAATPTACPHCAGRRLHPHAQQQRWLKRAVRQLGVEGLVSDDAAWS